MRSQTQPKIPPHRDTGNDSQGEFRFRALLSDADWWRLPPVVRRRFSRRLAGGEAVVCQLWRL
jgi:hypothetical protein